MNLEGWLKGGLEGLDGATLPRGRLLTLERMLLDIDPDLSIISVERMRSRKNVVLAINLASCNGTPERYVAKLYVTEPYEKELKILRDCARKHLRVPIVMRAESGVCLMEYLEGELLVDRLNRTFDESLAEEIAAWYYSFHSLQHMIKGDPRLRNFICTSDGLYGFDFEEAAPGEWMIDIAGISASMLDTDPIFDQRKRVLAWSVLDRYLDLRGEKRNDDTATSYVNTIADTLQQTGRWRSDSRIIELSKNIRSNGIPVD
jgi:hypothetical protein